MTPSLMQNFRNYYEILEVEQKAPIDEIKRSFRRLARRYHPDMNPGDKEAEEKFKDINEAYEVLSDEKRRAQYDSFSRYWASNGVKKGGKKGGKNGKNGGTGTIDPQEYPDFNRFVEEILNQQKTKGSYTAKSTRVNPKSPDAFRRTRTKTEYAVGSSRVTSRRTETGASRTVKRSGRRDIEARLSLPLEKAYKGGRERIRLEDGRSLEVEMPQGIMDQQKIRLREQGIEGGDLYLKITVEPHEFFELQGRDIFCQVPLTPSEAVLGGLVEVPTLDGLVKMNVPQGVRSGQRLRLANKGYPREDGSRGDQLVELKIVIPTTISSEEKAIYEKLREIETFKPRQDLLGFN